MDYTEGVTVSFDPSRVSFEDLLDFYFGSHDWRRSCDNHRQYMAGIWWHDEDQRVAVQLKIAGLESDTGATVASFNGPLNFSRLYRAEEYHQHYL